VAGGKEETFTQRKNGILYDSGSALLHQCVWQCTAAPVRVAMHCCASAYGSGSALHFFQNTPYLRAVLQTNH